MGLIEQLQVEPGRLVVTPHPLLVDGQRNVVWEARAGESLYAILQRNVPELDGQRWDVCIGGRAVERHLWHHVYPKNGQVIEVRGGVGRSALALVAVLALTYFTFGFGAATAGMWGAGAVAGSWGALAAAGVYMAGSMLINKVLAPKLARGSNQQQDAVYSISGARNQLRPYDPFPLLFGRVQITPDLLSKPYTWYEGNDQYLGLLLSAGINVGRIEALYNGDTPLSNYEGVQVYHAGYSQMPEQTIPLYSNADTIDGAELTKDKAWVERTTSADTVRIQINLEYVLGGTGTSGKSYFVSETVEAQYRPVGTTNWLPLVSQSFRSDRFDVRRATMARDVARGQYDVRVRMLGYGNYEGKNTQKNDFQWTQLTSIQADDADYTGIARSGVRIKATGQLNGSPDELRGVAFAAPIPEWSGTGWVTKESSNPGAQCVAYARGIWAGSRLLAGMALADAQIDIEAWKAFTLHCAANGYSYDFYVKEPRSHADVLAAIARAGFGEITWAGGRLGVVWAAQEQPLSGVVNMATIKKGTFQVDYTLANAADGIEFTYIDSADWQTKTLRVPAPGVEVMLNPAQVSGEGVSTEQHAARLARWHLAQSLYQYKDIGYSTDIEHLSYQRLSLLALQHDLTQWGYGGRVQAAVEASGAVTLTLDEPVPAPAAGNAYIGLRIPGERVYRVLRVQSFANESRTVTLAEPWPSDAPLPGSDAGNPAHDTIWVYDFKQTPGYRVRVTSIEPEGDLKGAAVRVVPEGPEFWDYVLNGHYVPAPNQSLLQTRPVASNLRITEQQVVQGNTTFTELTATFDVSGPVGNIVVLAAGTDMELQEVAQTQTRTATWRVPAADAYRIVVRPFSPDGEAGVAVSTLYATVGADVPPVLVDLFDVEERSGGVRLYTWGWLDDTMRSADFAGVEIRYVAGDVPAPVWDAMTPVGETGYHTAPFEAVVPAAGPWTFACRSRNSGGQLSTGMRIVTKTLSANLGEQIGGIGENLEEITQRQVAQQQAIDQEILDRLAGDFAAVAEAVADARAYTDTQVAALNGILEDIVGADEWVAGTTYPKGDFVRHEGTMYRALAENTGVVPGSNPSVWQEIGEYTSVGDALAAAISMSTQNASDIAAESTRLDGVVTRMPPGTDQLARSAQVASEQQARIDGDSTLGQRIDTANAAIAGKASTQSVQLLSGRVDTLGDTVVSQGNAITQVTSTANAAVNARPNAITNPYFSPVWLSAGAPGAWTVGVWGWVGGVAAVSQGNKAGGSAYIDSERIPVTPNTSYVASGDMMNLNNTLWGRVLIVWFNGETNIGSVWGTPIAGPFDFHVNNEFDFRKTMAVTGVSPANATHAMVRFNWDFDSNAGSYRVIGVRRPKFENGATPTPFSDDASGFSNAAAVVELKTRTTALEASSSVTTAALASLGGSANLLENSDFANGLDSAPTGWAYAWNPGGWAFVRKRPAGASWEPAGGVSIGAVFDGTPAVSAYGVVYQNGAQVIPGKRYIFSAFTANHRCTTRLAMRFMSSAGANVGEPGTDWSTADGNGGSSLTNWEYRWLSAVAPATAATVDAGVWVTGKAGAAPNPVFWLTRPMLEEASDSQTKPSPWSPNGNPKQSAAAFLSMSASVSAIDGKQRAMQVIATDVQGRWIGFRTENDGFRGGTEFVADYFRLLSPAGADGMEIQDGYIRIWKGNSQTIIGNRFGVAGQGLMKWFGPNIGAAACTKANATSWEDDQGNAYFGGSLSAGVLRNGAQSTQVGANAVVETGQFGTNGGPKMVTYSLSYSNFFITQTNQGGDGTLNATMVLERSIGGGAWVEVSRRSLVGSKTFIEYEAGVGYSYSFSIGGSSTFTDNTAGSSSTFNYRVRLEGVTGWPYAKPEGGANPWGKQSLTVLSIEE